MNIKRFGLIGHPLSHSFSPGYFSDKFEREGIKDCRYDAFPIPKITDLHSLLEQYPSLQGLNVTIPYKTTVIPLLNELSEEAAAIGAVNVIKVQGARLIGFNSDVYGFEQSLVNFLPSPIPPQMKALVLGTGGASKAVVFVLKKLGIPFQLVSRHETSNAISYAQVSPTILASHQLIVNTTPLGMAPKLDTCPALPYDLVTAGHFCYDLVYNPEKTKFLTLAEAAGAHVQNGLSMLHLQAEKAWEIWGDEWSFEI